MKEVLSHDKFNSRSVGHLQHLYSVIVALGLVEAVKSIFKLQNSLNIEIKIEYLPSFIAFLVTLVPFYHGASRYMDEIYLNPKSEIRPLTGLVDYFFFILEAITFYALSLFIPYPGSFFVCLWVLFLIDIIWLVFSYFNAPDPFNKVRQWLVLNILVGIVLYIFLFVKFMPNDMKKWILLAVFVTMRSILDYICSWKFFWPVV